MKLAIMQPYFFPYIGYFQLINCVDKFVFYDDVNYIKGGWVNRNRLFLAGAVRYVTVPLSGASSFHKINTIYTKLDEKLTVGLLSAIRQSYCKAPFFNEVAELFESVLVAHDGTLADISKLSILETCRYLGIKKEFVRSSDIYGNQSLSGVDRVLDICRRENASEYWNLPGGRCLYQEDEFFREGIDLKFQDVNIDIYPQFSPEFLPALSILDVLMFNDPESVNKMISFGSRGE